MTWVSRFGRLALLVFLGSTVAPKAAWANACTSEAVASMAETTCTIGELQFHFSGFSINSTNDGPNPLTPGSIRFIPDSSNPLHPGFFLEAEIVADSADSSAGSMVHFVLSFSVTPLNGAAIMVMDGSLDSYNVRPGRSGPLSLVQLDSDLCPPHCTGFTAGAQAGPGAAVVPSNYFNRKPPLSHGTFNGMVQLMASTGDGQGFAQINEAEYHYRLNEVPEPGTLLLAGSGLLGVIARVRGKQQG